MFAVAILLAQAATHAKTSPTDPAIRALTQAIRTCVVDRDPNGCSGTFRSVTFTIRDASSFEINHDLGERWRGSCKNDRVERRVSCGIRANGFSVWKIGPGFPGPVWGEQTYPGSLLTARIGAHPLMRFPSDRDLSPAQSAAVFRQMAAPNQVAYFRWRDWPYDADHDVVINTTGFPDALSFLNTFSAVLRDPKVRDGVL